MTLGPLLWVLATAIGLGASAVSARPIDCLVEPRSTTILSSAVEGIVTEVHVQRGDHVKEGELLIQLDDELERLQMDLTEARAVSDVNIRAQTARQQLRSKEYDRAVQLSDRNVAADTVREDAEIELALTDLALEEAMFNQKLAQIEVEQARAMWERRKIKSPANGIVLSVDINPGEFASEQKELLTIVDVDQLYIEVFAPAEFFGQIEQDLEVPVRLKPPLDTVFDARVHTVDEVFDAASGTFGVRLIVDNADGAITAGARCEVDFQGGFSD